MATIIGNNIPPLPPGFVLGNQLQQTSGQQLPVDSQAVEGSPPPPPGFVLESAQPQVAETPQQPLSLADRIAQSLADIGKGAVAGVAKLPLGATQLVARGAEAVFPESELAQDVEFATRRAELRRGALAEEARARSPIAATIAELVPQIGQLGPIGAGATTIPRIAAAGAGAGAVEAGLSPQLQDMSLLERSGNIATGAALGGVAGGTLGAAVKGVGAAARGVGRLFKGVDADKILSSRISQSQARKALSELKKSDIAILPDIAGDEIQGLTRAVAKVPGGPKNIVTDALEKRSEKAIGRVSRALSKNISDVDSYFANLDDIAKARSAVASPVYARAFKETPIVQSDKITKLLADDRIQAALVDGRRTFGISRELANNSIEVLDVTKKSLDDTISKALRAGENQRARAFVILKNDLVKEIDRINPTYKEARKIFSDFASLENAQREGLAFINKTPEQLKITLASLDNSQKEAFKIGVRENLQRIVSKTADQADPAKRVFGNEFKRDQLKAIFGDGNQFNKFSAKMRQEISAAKTKFKVLGGSRTDINLADEGDFINAVSDAARRGVIQTTLDRATTAIAGAARRKYIGLSGDNASKLAKILTDKEAGINALERLIASQKNETQKLLFKSIINDLTPVIAGVTATEALVE